MTPSITKALAERVRSYGPCCDAPDCVHYQSYLLASAVLAMAPVVEAAREWSKFGRDDSDDEFALLRAVDALTKEPQ